MIKLICGNALEQLDLLENGVSGQLGLEKTPEEYVDKMVVIFGQVKRVLKKEGTLWLNLGDSYNAMTGKGFPLGTLAPRIKWKINSI